jgi:hypothetical protein
VGKELPPDDSPERGNAGDLSDEDPEDRDKRHLPPKTEPVTDED